MPEDPPAGSFSRLSVKRIKFAGAAASCEEQSPTYIFVSRYSGRKTMKTHVKLGLAMLAGFGLGAGAVHELRAEATPPAYVISEIDVVDENGYANEYIPLANRALASSGQKRLASSGNTLAIAGEPPKSRIVLSIF